jgi:hypothetical protein
VNHQPTPENQNLCIYGDLTGFSYKRSYDQRNQGHRRYGTAGRVSKAQRDLDMMNLDFFRLTGFRSPLSPMRYISRATAMTG